MTDDRVNQKLIKLRDLVFTRSKIMEEWLNGDPISAYDDQVRQLRKINNDIADAADRYLLAMRLRDGFRQCQLEDLNEDFIFRLGDLKHANDNAQGA